MFGISFTETLIILIVVLIVYGPERLPETARSLGKIFGSLRKQTNDLRREFYNTIYTPVEKTAQSLKSSERNLISSLQEKPTESNDKKL